MTKLLATFCLIGFFNLGEAFAATDFSVCPDVSKIPDGVYDPNLKISDVMYQFQDQLNFTSQIIYEARSGRAADPLAAIDHVESARNCALLAARNGKTTMMPGKAKTLPPDQQAAYLENFVQTMHQFSELLLQYRMLFEQLQATTPASRNYDAVDDFSMQVEEFGNEAHHKF